MSREGRGKVYRGFVGVELQLAFGKECPVRRQIRGRPARQAYLGRFEVLDHPLQDAKSDGNGRIADVIDRNAHGGDRIGQGRDIGVCLQPDDRPCVHPVMGGDEGLQANAGGRRMLHQEAGQTHVGLRHSNQQACMFATGPAGHMPEQFARRDIGDEGLGIVEDRGRKTDRSKRRFEIDPQKLHDRRKSADISDPQHGGHCRAPLAWPPAPIPRVSRNPRQ